MIVGYIPLDVRLGWSEMQAMNMESLHVLQLWLDYPNNDADTFLIPEWALSLLMEAAMWFRYGPHCLHAISCPGRTGEWSSVYHYYAFNEPDPGRMFIDATELPVQVGGEVGVITDEVTGEETYGLTIDFVMADGSNQRCSIPAWLMPVIAEAIPQIRFGFRP